MYTTSTFHLPFEVEPMGYDETLAQLKGILRLGISPMLETVIDMLEVCGRPDSYYDVIQVGGTNGKTSTSRFTASLLSGCGLKVGLYTSPELVRYNERMEIAGEPVGDEEFAYGIAAAIKAGSMVNAERISQGLDAYDITEFDTLTVAALVMYARAGVDVAVLEVGMGGRWDATSATKPVTTCVTGIGLDHTRILGDTLPEIATEKAAIIKRGQTCVIGEGCLTNPEVFSVFASRCSVMDVSPVLVCRKHAGYPVDVSKYAQTAYTVMHAPTSLKDELVVNVSTPGATYMGLAAVKPSYQAANIAAALTVAESYLGAPVADSVARRSIADTPTPGRFDTVSVTPLRVIDAAHNPQSIQTFLRSVAQVEPDVAKRPALLLAVLKDKDVQGIVELVVNEFPTIYVTETDSARALPAGELADVVRAAGVEPAGVYASVAEALGALCDTDLVATGSITLAGAVAGLVG